MRGRREPQVSMLAFVDPEARVPLEHPLRTIKAIAFLLKVLYLDPASKGRGVPALP